MNRQVELAVCRIGHLWNQAFIFFTVKNFLPLHFFKCWDYIWQPWSFDNEKIFYLLYNNTKHDFKPIKFTIIFSVSSQVHFGEGSGGFGLVVSSPRKEPWLRGGQPQGPERVRQHPQGWNSSLRVRYLCLFKISNRLS